ncbi:MAG: GNAT family N-acetyltransferase [Pseudonocardiales bacterium]
MTDGDNPVLSRVESTREPGTGPSGGRHPTPREPGVASAGRLPCHSPGSSPTRPGPRLRRRPRSTGSGRGLSVTDRARRWAQFFDDGTVGQILLAERKGVLLGFSNVGPSRDDGADANTGELYALYLHPNAWGFGVGRVLHAATVQLLAEQGFTAATLWVLSTNQRARGFYEHSGWSLDDQEKIGWRGEIQLVEIRYRLVLPER